MSLIADPQQWAEHTFASCALGRSGRADRLVFCAARIAAGPQKSFPQLFDWDELRAFYRLCDKPDSTPDAMRRDWYACRWLIEQFHDVEKNGCREESRRFETAERMGACLAVLSVIAVRVLSLRLALEERPQEAAQQVATQQEVEVLGRRLGEEIETVQQFVRGVARLGGFLAPKGDKEPGVRTLWRGYQRLQDMLAGYRLHDDFPPCHNPHDDSPPGFL